MSKKEDDPSFSPRLESLRKKDFFRGEEMKEIPSSHQHSVSYRNGTVRAALLCHYGYRRVG